VCGVSQGLPGFSIQEADGSYSGFDADYCKAIAAAVLGDADAVDFVELSAAARFTALQSGEIDVLVRNTTWTATRDGAEGAAFAMTTFYDGQGMMVDTDSGIDSIDDMANTTICVQAGTTTQLNLESTFAARGLPYTALTFEGNDQLQEAYFEGRCDGWTSDLSQLAAFRGTWPAEQGGIAVGEDPSRTSSPRSRSARWSTTVTAKWFDVVNWVVIATIQAEEFGITSANVDSIRAATNPDENPEVGRFLGLVDGFDPGLGSRRRLGVQHRQPGRQLRGDLPAQRRAGHAARPAAWRELPVDRGRPALRPAVPLIERCTCTTRRVASRHGAALRPSGRAPRALSSAERPSDA
jgi:general L-amino acid transport system substrate-binding protein